MLLITKTCEIITEDSAENGEAHEQWVDFENAEFEFRELVKNLKHKTPSCYPITECNAQYVWFTENGEQDFRTGDYENYSLHYSKLNPARNLKHWIAAIKAAGYKVK